MQRACVHSPLLLCFCRLITSGRRGRIRMFTSPLSVFWWEFSLSFITWLFFFSRKLYFLRLIGNKISCHPFLSVMIIVTNKSDSRFLVVRFCYHSHMIICKYYRLNWTSLSPRDHDLREHIPHTWASSNDNLFQSNFSAWSSCEAILGKTPDWPI